MLGTGFFCRTFNLNFLNCSKIPKFRGFCVEEFLKPFFLGEEFSKGPTVGCTDSQEGLTTWKVPEDNFEERHGFGKKTGRKIIEIFDP